MNIDQVRINNLVSQPSEGLNVEVKRWIDPDSPEGIAKIAKACLGIRNRNGGFLIVGFDDGTLLPHLANVPTDVRLTYNLDKIQGIISKYASEVFEVGVGFGVRDNQEFPVIVIPDGITAPVIARSDLKGAGGKLLIRGGNYMSVLYWPMEHLVQRLLARPTGET
jgi:hypothetical protein